MKSLYRRLALFSIGIGLLMGPVSNIVQGVASLLSLAGLILVLDELLNLEFEQRKKILKRTGWVFLLIMIPYGMVVAPKVELATQIGNQIDGPWLMAIYYAIGFPSGITAIAALVLNLLSTGGYFLGSNGGSPPGPEDL